jgi:hypothetical protein
MQSTAERRVAALKVKIEDYPNKLNRASEHLRYIVSDPLGLIPLVIRVTRNFLIPSFCRNRAKIAEYQVEMKAKNERNTSRYVTASLRALAKPLLTP